MAEMISDPLPDTLEAAILHLERWRWCWKLTSYLDKSGHRTCRALVYRPDWPPGFGRRRHLAGTPVAALRRALSQAQGLSAELKRQQTQDS